MDRMECFADRLAEAMPAPAAQPAPIDAADRAETVIVGGQPPQGPFADVLEPQQAGLLPAKCTKLRRLGAPPRLQRRGRRVIGGTGLARQRPSGVAAAKAGLHLQQVRHPQPKLILADRREVLQAGRLPATVHGQQPASRRRPAVRVVD